MGGYPFFDAMEQKNIEKQVVFIDKTGVHRAEAAKTVCFYGFFGRQCPKTTCFSMFLKVLEFWPAVT